MRVGLHILKPETVPWLRRELRRGELTRAALGRGLCEQEQWRNRQGRPCVVYSATLFWTLIPRFFRQQLGRYSRFDSLLPEER